MTESEHNMVHYEDAYAHFSLHVPEYFNFGFDVIDEWARKDRNKLAMIWTNQKGEEKKYTFWDLMIESNKAANILLKYGVHKGDRVMIMLHRVPEWWILTLALIKLGAVYVPSPTMLTAKDILYRVNTADIKMVITDRENAEKIERICGESPTIQLRMVVDGEIPEWISYPQELRYPAPVSGRLVNLLGMQRTRASDPLVIFFTSGTTGEPKMVLHPHSYPLGHIVTARFWQDIRSTDLHFTYSDPGWAKSAWGKIFGQWIEGAAIFVYDVRGKFKPTEPPPPGREVRDHHLLCTPDHLPHADPCRPVQVRLLRAAPLRERRGAPEPGGDPHLEGRDGDHHPRRVRADGDGLLPGHLPLHAGEARLHGKTVPGLEDRAAR
jgi:Acyl-coenzyme A synthetases/AMP-(fatty) acid ligases